MGSSEREYDSAYEWLLLMTGGGGGMHLVVVSYVLSFVAGWRHALWSEWPFIIIIMAEIAACIKFPAPGGGLPNIELKTGA